MGRGTSRRRSSFGGGSLSVQSRNQVYIGLGLAGVAVLVLLVFMVSGRGKGTVEDVPRAKPAARGPVAPAEPDQIEVRTAPPKPAPEPPKPEPFPADLAEIDGHVRSAAAAEEYARGIEILKASRGRYPLAEWMAAIDRRIGRLREEAGGAYFALEAKALDARRRGAEDEVKAARRRVEKWGLGEYPARFEKALSAIPLAEQPWKPLFDGSSASFLRDERGWRVEGGALVRVPGGPVAAESRETFTDGEVRIRFQARGPGYVFFAVRQGLDGNSGVHLDEEALKALGDAEHVLVFSMSGEKVAAALDGKPAKVSTMGRPRSGTLQFNAQGASLRVRAVEHRPQ